MTNQQRLDSYMKPHGRRASWWNTIHKDGSACGTSLTGTHGHGYPVTPRQARRLMHNAGPDERELNRMCAAAALGGGSR